MLLTIVVLIPKGSSGKFRGIGLLEVIWKLLDGYWTRGYRRLGSMIFSMASAPREAAASASWRRRCTSNQQLATREQVPLYGGFLSPKGILPHEQGLVPSDLKDAGVCRAQGASPRPHLLGQGHPRLPCLQIPREPLHRQMRCHLRRPALPTIFNIMVDAITQEWVRLMEASGFGATDIGTIATVFYADDGLVHQNSSPVLSVWGQEIYFFSIFFFMPCLTCY